MEYSMSRFALSLPLALLLGIALGAVYDIVRFTRVFFGVSVSARSKLPSQIFVFFGDFVFLLICAVCFSVFFFLTGNGEMRALPLISAFLGFEIYYHTLGRLFIGTAEFLSRRLRSAFGWVFGKIRGITAKSYGRFLKIPIVRKLTMRYNECVKRRKIAIEAKKRKKRMAKGGCTKNGI